MTVLNGGLTHHIGYSKIMGKINIEKELKDLCKELSVLYQNVIIKKGLIKTGALLRSVRWTYVKVGNSYQLEMVAKDYFKFLNDRYNLQSIVQNSREYKRLIKRIALLIAEIQKENLIKELNGNNNSRKPG